MLGRSGVIGDDPDFVMVPGVFDNMLGPHTQGNKEMVHWTIVRVV